ncbi:hypothetical protein ACSBR1_024159 [Camellia fascicularis]
MALANNYPWICIGDFNEIGLIGEKEGGSEWRMTQLQFFLELLSDCALLDLEFKGCPFTWSNNQRGVDNVRERLDRAVANVEWRTLFPCAQVFHKLQIGSDHCFAVLNCCVPLKRVPRIFKFETMWSTSLLCEEVIHSKWDEPHIGSPMYQLLQKLKLCRESLKAWSKEHFGNNQIQISRLKSELETLQAQPFSDDNLRNQLHVKADLELFLAREEMFYHQRSRTRWPNFGDKNTNFFHASMIQQRQRNQILQLQTKDGTRLSSDTESVH